MLFTEEELEIFAKILKRAEEIAKILKHADETAWIEDAAANYIKEHQDKKI